MHPASPQPSKIHAVHPASQRENMIYILTWWGISISIVGTGQSFSLLSLSVGTPPLWTAAREVSHRFDDRHQRSYLSRQRFRLIFTSVFLFCQLLSLAFKTQMQVNFNLIFQPRQTAGCWWADASIPSHPKLFMPHCESGWTASRMI